MKLARASLPVILLHCAILLFLWAPIERCSSAKRDAREDQANLFEDPDLDLIARKLFSSFKLNRGEPVKLPELRQLRNNYKNVKELLGDLEDLPSSGKLVELLIKDNANWTQYTEKFLHKCFEESTICDTCPKRGQLVMRLCDNKCAKLHKEAKALNSSQCDSLELSKCPACPLQSWCPPIPEGERCPPKPICPKNLCDIVHKKTNIPIASPESIEYCQNSDSKKKRARCMWVKPSQRGLFGSHARNYSLKDPELDGGGDRAKKRACEVDLHLESLSPKSQIVLTLAQFVELSASDWPAQIGKALSQTIGGNFLELLGDVKDLDTAKVIKDVSGKAYSAGTNLYYANKLYEAIQLELNRRHCNCPRCEPFASDVKCDCRKSKYKMKLSEYDAMIPASGCETTRICLPCQAENHCPVPLGCPANPTCQECAELKLSGFVPDDPELAALLDNSDLVSQEELERPFSMPEKCTYCDDFKTCGKAPLNKLYNATSRRKKLRKRILGGYEAHKNYWPSFVGIRSLIMGNESFCGGVVVSRRQVLTAAHCVSKRVNLKDITVVTDQHKNPFDDDFEKVKPEDKHKVESVCKHKKFKLMGGGGIFDIALLTLEKDLEFDDKIQPACLPHDPSLLSESQCYSMGFGAVGDTWGSEAYPSQGSEKKKPPVMQEIEVKRFSCNKFLVSDSDRSRICFSKVGGPGNPCKGDSGGPILCRDNAGRWTAVGVVSYGGDYCDGEALVGWTMAFARLPTLLEALGQECKLFA